MRATPPIEQVMKIMSGMLEVMFIVVWEVELEVLVFDVVKLV
jgi:hypothetical protein